MKKKLTALLIMLLMILSLMGCSIEFVIDDGGNVPVDGECLVHFIDIGQGDATLIQINDVNTLIDTGTSSHYDELQAYLEKAGVEVIDNFIVTHPDADHMGGAYKVIRDYDVEGFYSTNTTSDSQAYEKMMAALRQNKLKKQVVAAGDTIDFGEGAKANVIGPIGTCSDRNESSVVIRLDYGKTSYLFTGDTTARMENKMNKKYDIDVDVLKVSHHGGDTASGVKFVSDASPDYAVISVGADNNYGHPDRNVLRRLKEYTNEQILRTDKLGNIIIASDGENLSVSSGKQIDIINHERNTSLKKDTTKSQGEIIGNKNSKVYHLDSESRLPAEDNREYFQSEKAAIKEGYRACEKCFSE